MMITHRRYYDLSDLPLGISLVGPWLFLVTEEVEPDESSVVIEEIPPEPVPEVMREQLENAAITHAIIQENDQIRHDALGLRSLEFMRFDTQEVIKELALVPLNT